MPSTATRLALASPHAAASEAGREAFVDGGTAVDAALAACATLTVVYPHMCSIGGDLIALLHAPDGTVTAVNASGAAPAALTREAVVAHLEGGGGEGRADGGADGQGVDGGAGRGIDGGARSTPEIGPHGMPIRGPHTVTVPGVLSGWAKLHELGGALEWGRILRPAVERAAAGMTVSRGLAAMFADAPELVLADPGLRAVFAPDGRLPREGDGVRQPTLAASLKILSHDGVDAFYRGPLGAAFVGGLQSAGSVMTVDDLAAHTVDLTAPLGLTAFGHEFMTAPPNSQGFVLLELLGALERLVAGAAIPPDPLGDAAGVIAHLFRLVSGDRERHLCDPRAFSVPLDDLLGSAHLAAVIAEAQAQGGPGRARNGVPGRDLPRRGGDATDGDTIACVAADSDGWAVSVIQSLYYGFGSGILEPSTGIVAQNRGACFSLDPRSPNVVEGRKRPLHTLMPVLVKRGGRLVLVPGTMGGEAQPQIHAQILSRLLKGDVSAHEAVAAPRWIWDDGALYAEADVPDACRGALQASGLPLIALGALDDSVGHAQYLRIGGDGGFDAGSDPRADGAAVLAERP